MVGLHSRIAEKSKKSKALNKSLELGNNGSAEEKSAAIAGIKTKWLAIVEGR